MQAVLIIFELLFLAIGPALALALPFGVEMKKAIACFVVAALAVARIFWRTFTTGEQELQIGDTLGYELLRNDLSLSIALFVFLFLCVCSALFTRQFAVDRLSKLAVIAVTGGLSLVVFWAAKNGLSDQTIIGVAKYVRA
ncbi:MAG: hypothetical protein ACRCU5_14875 [Rhizobiaceae bacterium]